MVEHGMDRRRVERAGEEQEEYIVLRDSVLRDRRLSPSDKLIYSMVLSFNGGNRSCYATDEYLARRFGISDRSVRRSISRLEALGLIRRHVTPEGVRHLIAASPVRHDHEP